LLREAHGDLKALHKRLGLPLPKNRKIGDDLLLRPLDCAVINFLHQTRVERNLRAFDTVRAAFAEGGPLYPGSGVTAKHHIQICVRRRSCVLSTKYVACCVRGGPLVTRHETRSTLEFFAHRSGGPQ
jgi:hypothetical protein